MLVVIISFIDKVLTQEFIFQLLKSSLSLVFINFVGMFFKMCSGISWPEDNISFLRNYLTL